MSILDPNISPIKVGDLYKVTLFWQTVEIIAPKQTYTVVLPYDAKLSDLLALPSGNLEAVFDVKQLIDNHELRLPRIENLPLDADEDTILRDLIDESTFQFRSQVINVIRAALSDDPLYMIQVGYPQNECGRPIVLNGTPFIKFTRKHERTI